VTMGIRASAGCDSKQSCSQSNQRGER
jgi:hypothetical protein